MHETWHTLNAYINHLQHAEDAHACAAIVCDCGPSKSTAALQVHPSCVNVVDAPETRVGCGPLQAVVGTDLIKSVLKVCIGSV